MAVNLRVLVPDGTTNYITNPSLRYDTTGYTAVGSAVSRTLDQARFNVASLKVDTNGSAVYEGCYYRVNGLSGISEPITASVYVRGAGIVRLRLIDNPYGKQWYSPPVYLVDRWTRISVSGYSTGSNDLRVYVETDQRAQDAVFYVDGVQLERKAYPTTFCDGDQPGCRWTGLYHSSSSTRTPYTRQGGRWVDLAGPCRADDNIYVTVIAGMGMAPKVSQKQPWALESGSYFQNTKVLDRRVTLTFHAKNPKRVLAGKSNLGALHHLRQQLVDIFKPDRTYDSEELVFEYQVGDRPLYFKGRYESGLEGDWDIRNQWVSSMAISFAMLEPLLFEDNYQVQQLGFIESLYKAPFPTSIAVLSRIDGRWTPISADGTGYWSGAVNMNAIAIGKRGEIYFGKQYIYRWDDSGVTLIGTTNNINGPIYTMMVDHQGDLYVGGYFQTIDGVANTSGIAKWNGSNWIALGVGTESALVTKGVFAIHEAPNGQIYVGGRFSTAGGVAMENIARWDGTQWRTVGPNSGLWTTAIGSGYVVNMKTGIDGRTIFVIGHFLTDGNQSLKYVASLDMNTNLFSPLGDGFNTTGRTLAVDRDGTVYAGGLFSQNGAGTKDLRGVAFWNGKDWFELGNLEGSVYAYEALIDQRTRDLYFMTAGHVLDGLGPSDSPLSRWSGDRRTSGDWHQVDLRIKRASAAILGGVISQGGNLTIIPSTSYYGIDIAQINQVTNIGSHEAYPIFYVKGPGKLKMIENQTTGKSLSFLLECLPDEEITIDCGKQIFVSSVRGDLSYALIPVSSLADMRLAPGVNKISAFMVDDVNGKIQIGYTPQHWSADSVVDTEALS